MPSWIRSISIGYELGGSFEWAKSSLVISFIPPQGFYFGLPSIYLHFRMQLWSITFGRDSSYEITPIVNKDFEKVAHLFWKASSLRVLYCYFSICFCQSCIEYVLHCSHNTLHSLDAKNFRLTFDDCPDVHAVAGVLKQYLRELPDPLLTMKCYDDFTRNTCKHFLC